MTVQACADLVQRGDPDRFLATMTAGPAQRAHLFPLYAFNLEVARAPWVTAEPMIAEMRLQWWRDAVEEIGAGKPARAHEVTGPLAETITKCALPVAVFDRLIAARRWDIYSDPFPDAAAFRGYIDDTAGGLMWLAALTCGAAPGQESQIRAVGYAGGVAAILRAVPTLEERGRRPVFDGRPGAVRDLAQEALKGLRQARRPSLRAVAPALRAAWLAEAILKQVVADPRRVAKGALGLSDFRRRASLLRCALTGSW